MKRTEFFQGSSDGRTQLHGYSWEPEGEIKAVVQIVHGMEEYIDRYDGFAAWLTAQGYAVIGHDQLGHGRSLRDPSELSYFAERNGTQILLQDMHSITQMAKQTWPGKPLFILGHSMGSFETRRYITLYPQEADGIIISGTGDNPLPPVRIGLLAASLLKTLKGSHYKSRLIDKMALGSYGTLDQWLCSVAEVVKTYEQDPLCGVPFTVGAYYDLFKLLEALAQGRDRERIPKDLPILLISGMRDPVGEKSRGVLRVYNRFIRWGLTRVDIILYKDDLHEILNEKNKTDVFRDIRNFIEKYR